MEFPFIKSVKKRKTNKRKTNKRKPHHTQSATHHPQPATHQPLKSPDLPLPSPLLSPPPPRRPPHFLFSKTHMKKMNCSPFVENQKADETTCYTNGILMEIRNAFNAQPKNNKSPIKSNNPKIILYQLRKRMSKTCKKEKCWLSMLSPEQQKVVDEMVFAPEKPPEWKSNPNEWLSNYDILKVLKQYEKSTPTFKFIEPTPIDFDTVLTENGSEKCVTDDLCHFSLKYYIEHNYKQIGIIFNLDKHDQKGSHWVSLFIDIEHSFIFYFDSAANRTPKEIQAFVEKIKEQSLEIGERKKYYYYENYPNNHQRSNSECGMYSLNFIITMLDKHKYVKSKIRLFKEQKIPDKHMRMLRNVYFND